MSYHFLNDELRVQEGIQESSIAEFITQGWYMAAPELYRFATKPVT